MPGRVVPLAGAADAQRPRLSYEHSSYRWTGPEELEAADVTPETTAVPLQSCARSKT
jgi:hypothetical protein